MLEPNNPRHESALPEYESEYALQISRAQPPATNSAPSPLSPHKDTLPRARIAFQILSSPRLTSLDALRGFDMFWIVGAGDLVHGLEKISCEGIPGALAGQLHHKVWAGLNFEDQVFPMFVFIAGVSLVFSLEKTLRETDRWTATLRILRRAALLYFLGILSYGGFSTPFEEIRLLGVLQRIALCYFGGRVIGFEGLAKLFVGGPIGAAFGPYAELVLALTTLGFGFWFLRFLYHRKIFLRV